MVEVPDSTTRYIQSDSGKPTKDLFNWMRNINQQLADILSGTGGGLFSSGIPCFSVHKAGTPQGIVNATATQVTFSTAVYNIGNYFASNAWTPPAGKVHLTGGYVADPDAGTSTGCLIAFRKNGTQLKFAIGTNDFAICSANAAIDDVANGTDVYSLWCFMQNTAVGNSAIRGGSDATWFMGHWISP